MRKPGFFMPALCALFAALTAICAVIPFPSVGPIPFSLGTFAVLLSGGVLGPKYGPLSQLVYIMLGLCGLPVFAGFQSGWQALAGPSGGFLAGYVIAAFAAGLLLRRLPGHLPGTVFLMAIGPVCYFLPGFFWFMHCTGGGAWASLMAAVLPFLPGDAVKLILAGLLTRRLRPVLQRYGV